MTLPDDVTGSPGAGPYRVRVTDVHERSAVAEGVTLSPGVLQTTTARLS